METTVEQKAQELVIKMKEAAQYNLLFASEDVNALITFKNIDKNILEQAAIILKEEVREPSNVFNTYNFYHTIGNISIFANSKEYKMEKKFIEA